MKFINANFEEYIPTRFLSYDDITLMPQYCPMESRLDSRVDLDTVLTPTCRLGIPIISANMDCVTGPKMAIAMAKLGGLGILHRFFDTEEQRLDAVNACVTEIDPVVSVGVADGEIMFVDKLLKLGVTDICIDIAHCHSVKMERFIRSVRNLDPTLNIIAGNVCTVDAAKWLHEVCGVECIKVGIGNGAACTTRLVTGHGVPQASALYNIRRSIPPHIKLIADGGIRNSGDIVKALALGANAVMIGKMFAGCDESAAAYHGLSHSLPYKVYRGQSSHDLQKEKGMCRPGISPEGISYKVLAGGSIKDFVGEYVGGIRSGMTYSGAYSISLLQEKAMFIEVSQHGYIEGTPHGYC
jgi:IMP dehydrogenase